jgi:hypothetical protein
MKYLMIACGILVLMTSFSLTGYKKIFNGKDLTGWTIHGTEKWYVDKQYGYLSTDKNYDNFILDLDFKLEANGNSGVFIRSAIDGTKISGWQVEVAPPMHSTGGIYESYGRGWLVKPTEEGEKALKATDWNHMRIKADGDVVTSWLNGKQMVSLKDEKIGQGKGFIALQIHDGGGIKVRWKNIRIKELK